jgi:hypothetical protein
MDLEPEPDPEIGGGKMLKVGIALIALAGLVILGLVILLFRGPGEAEVQVSSDPMGAEVHIDGRRQPGTTPMVIRELTPGPHRIAIHLEGYRDHEAELFAREGHNQLSYGLRRREPEPAAQAGPSAAGTQEGQAEGSREGSGEGGGQGASSGATGGRPTVTIHTHPHGALVYINGHRVGHAPIVDHPVYPGRVRLRIRTDDRSMRRQLSFEIGPGEHVERTYRLHE